MIFQKYSGCRKGLGKVTGYPVADGDVVYLVTKEPHTGMTFFAVDPETLEPVIETNLQSVTATTDAFSRFVDRVYRWGKAGGCLGCPVDDMFCESGMGTGDCRAVLEKWLQKPVRKEQKP